MLMLVRMRWGRRHKRANLLQCFATGSMVRYAVPLPWQRHCDVVTCVSKLRVELCESVTVVAAIVGKYEDDDILTVGAVSFIHNRPKWVPMVLPGVLVWFIWLFVVQLRSLWGLFVSEETSTLPYHMTIVMVFGSIVAGAMHAMRSRRQQHCVVRGDHSSS